MMLAWLSDASATLGLTERIVAVGTLIASLELLARASALRETGMLSWSVARLRSKTLSVGWIADRLEPVFNPPGVYRLIWIRAAAALLLMTLPSGSIWSIGALIIAAVTSFMVMLRTSYGNDGADQMTLIVLISSVIARLIGTPRVIEYALWFIALQCCLSYLTSGIGKLAGRSWRDGTGIIGILNTKTYGVPSAARVLERHRWLAVLLSWTIILTELSFGLVLFVPDQWVILMLAGGLAFHFANAIVMGLNAFVWSFGAAYPALVFLAIRQS